MCGRPGVHVLTSGRALCAACFQRLGQQTGAGSAMVQGEDVGSAVARAITTGHYAGAVAADRAYQRRLRAKLDRTEGFWRRLWVRVVG